VIQDNLVSSLSWRSWPLDNEASGLALGHDHACPVGMDAYCVDGLITRPWASWRMLAPRCGRARSFRGTSPG